MIQQEHVDITLDLDHQQRYKCKRNTPGDVNAIDYITIASTGDATDFGDLNLLLEHLLDQLQIPQED